MKICFKKNRGRESAFLKTSDKDIYLGPKDGVGKNEIENIVKALNKTDEVLGSKYEKYEKIRGYLLGRLERAVSEYKDQ